MRVLISLAAVSGIMSLVLISVALVNSLEPSDAMECRAGGFSGIFYGPYASDICTCVGAVISGQERSIEDFVCGPGGTNYSPSKVAYQVIFDRESRLIDADVEKYIKSLQQSSQPSAQLVDLTADIEQQLALSSGTFAKRYDQLCERGDTSVLAMASHALGTQYSDGAIKDFLATTNNANVCQRLNQRKLLAYRKAAEVAANIAMVKNRSDDRNKYMSQVEESYEKLLDQFRYYLEEVGTIYARMKP